MNTYLIVSPTGAIVGIDTRAEFFILVEQEPEDPRSLYYDFESQSLQPRQPMPLEVQENIISGIPQNSVVTLTGPIEATYGGITDVFKLTSDIAGQYLATVSNGLLPQWLPTTVEIQIP